MTYLLERKTVKLVEFSAFYPGPTLITLEIKLPKCLVAQFNTHSNIRRNSASTRAIPIDKQFDRIRNDMFIPGPIFRNKKGMSGTEQLPLLEADEFEKDVILFYENHVTPFVQKMKDKYNIHKQTLGRYLEPFMYTTICATANGYWWVDLVNQRDTEHTQPEFREVAQDIKSILSVLSYRTGFVISNEDLKKEYDEKVAPYHNRFEAGQTNYHLPYLTREERGLFEMGQSYDGTPNKHDWCKISAARAARVSYLNQAGQRDYADDLDLFRRLKEDRHFSPLEHVARNIFFDDLRLSITSESGRMVKCGAYEGYASMRHWRSL